MSGRPGQRRRAGLAIAGALALAAFAGAPARATAGGAGEAPALAFTAPAEGAELLEERPALAVSGRLDAADRRHLRLVLDGDDLSEFLRWERDQARALAPLPLAPGDHVAELRLPAMAGSGEQTVARVRFRLLPPGQRVIVNARVNDSPVVELSTRETDAVTLASHTDGGLHGAHGELTWEGTWGQRFALDGPSEDLVPPNAVLHLRRGRMQLDAGSLVEPRTFAGARFLGARTHRKAVEASFTTAALGQVTLFSNLADALPGSGGERSFNQWIQGARIATDLGQRLQLVLLAEVVRDRAGSDQPASSISTPARAEILGFAATARLGHGFALEGEAALSGNATAAGAGGDDDRETGAALRAGVRGKVAEHQVEAGFARVGAEYANPADPGLVRDREEASLTVARRRPRLDYRARLAYGQDGLDPATDSSRELRYGLEIGGKLPAEVEAKAGWERQAVSAAGRGRDQARTQIGLGRRFGPVRVDLKASHTVSGNAGGGETAQDAVQAAASLAETRGFALRGGFGLDWRDEAGRDTRASSFSLEPALKLAAERFRVGLHLARSAREVPGSVDSERWSALGTFTWRIAERFSGLSLATEAGWDESRDRRIGRVETDRHLDFKLLFTPQASYGPR